MDKELVKDLLHSDCNRLKNLIKVREADYESIVKGRVKAKHKSDAWDSGNILTRFYEVVYVCGFCGGAGIMVYKDVHKKIGFCRFLEYTPRPILWKYCPKECEGVEDCVYLQCKVVCPSCLGQGEIVAEE